MNALFKYLFALCVVFFQLSLSAQNEYEDDLEFQSFGKKEKITKRFEGKRKINVHFQIAYNLSTVVGNGVKERRDTLDARAKFSGFDSYRISPSYWPQAEIDLSLNFTKKISLAFGLKYSLLGWKEIARVRSGNLSFRGMSYFKLHKLSIPIVLQFHPTPALSVFVGTSLAVSVKNEIVEKVLYTIGKDTITNYKDILDFEKTTQVEPRIVTPQIFLGSHFGFDRFRFNINFIFTPNFIRNDIAYHNIAAEAGLIIKLFKDYDNKF